MMYVAIVLALLLPIWWLLANEITHKDRLWIIRNLFDRTTVDVFAWEKADTSFHSVSYYKHFWYRITFRNPFKLYPHLNGDTQ